MNEFLLQLWKLVKPYRFRLGLGVLMGLLAGLAEPLLIPLVKVAAEVLFPTGKPGTLDQLTDKAPFLHDWLQALQSYLHIQPRDNSVAVLAIVICIPVVVVLRGVLGYLNVYLMQWAAIRAVTDLRVQLFTHLTRLPLRFFENSRTGELMSRISADTAILQTMISQSTAIIVKDPATIIGVMACLFWLRPTWTLASLLIFPIGLIPVVIYNRKVRQSSREIQSQFAETNSIMHESFTGVRVVKAYNLEGTVVERFQETSRAYVNHFMRLVRAQEIPGPLLEFLAGVSIAGFFLYLGLFANPKPDAGEFLGFILGMITIYKPAKTLTRLQSQIELARAASQRVFDLLTTPSDLPEPVQPKPLHAAGADIHFDHVSFAYHDVPVLQEIEVRIQPGQLVALVGASGSGKTTLASLLLRFYDPQQGSIRIGGIDLRDISTHDLRNQIALVTQETVLFNDTFWKNIEYGRPGASREEITTAAQRAYAHEFIAEKTRGYDTIIGEKGVLVSGGQRQRVAIARAILKNAPILVLDEATSALDSESERAVQVALEELMAGRTTLCIAHRLSTIQKADLIVVLDQGRIREKGTHGELLAVGGIYRRLHDAQFKS